MGVALNYLIPPECEYRGSNRFFENLPDLVEINNEWRDRRFLELDELIAQCPSEPKPPRIVIHKLGRPRKTEEEKLATRRAGWKRQHEARAARKAALKAARAEVIEPKTNHCPDCQEPQVRRGRCPDCKRAYHRAYLAKWREANQRMVHGKLVGRDTCTA
jgi:hypothetical protein